MLSQKIYVPLDLCVYCGEPANSNDHVIPWCYFQFAWKRRHGKTIGWTVRACTDCNVRLGSKFFTTVYERREYIHRKLSAKLAGMTKPIPPEEIAVLGRSLRTMVEAHVARYDLLRMRVEYAARTTEIIVKTHNR